MSNPSGVTHCVMRRGASWFAFPAERVREVLFRTPLLSVPHSDPLLAGLCYVRSEFFPVLRLDSLVVEDPANLVSERQMLVLHGEEGPWGVLVDQVTALAALETSAAPEEDFHENWSDVVSGWAAHETQVVRVLDPQRFYSLADHLLCESWSNSPAVSDIGETKPDRADDPRPSPLDARKATASPAADGLKADLEAKKPSERTTTQDPNASEGKPQMAHAPSQPGLARSAAAPSPAPSGNKGE